MWPWLWLLRTIIPSYYSRAPGAEDGRSFVQWLRPPARSLILLLHYPQGTGVEEVNWVSPFKPRLCSFQWLSRVLHAAPLPQKPAN